MAPATRKRVEAELKKASDNDWAFFVRTRFTIAQINAGAQLLPALSRGKYRLVTAAMIAVGGAAAVVTTVDLLGTQSGSSVKLLAAAQAQLTQSTYVSAGSTGGAILADGASFVACDRNTALTVGKTGGDVTTATHIDVLVAYVIEGDVTLP